MRNYTVPQNASEPERNVEDCKITLRHMVIGVRSNPTMHANIPQVLARKLSPCDLDYEKNCRFFHYFPKILGIMKKIAVFFTIKED